MSTVVCWFQRTLKQLEREQTDRHTHKTMKALKCKTLGGIHMQSTAAMELCTYTSLVPRPRPSTRERGSGNFSRFSWHFVRFKSCDTCLCACAFQQQARDPRTASCPGGGVWVAVTREFERDNCVISEILQSDWTIPNRAGVPLKFRDPLSCGSHVRVWDRYTSVVYILRMRVRVPRCLRPYLACFTPVAPVASL